MVPDSECIYKLIPRSLYPKLIPHLHHLPIYESNHVGVPNIRNCVDELNMSLPKGNPPHLHLNGSKTLKKKTFREHLIKCSGYSEHSSRYSRVTQEVP